MSNPRHPEFLGDDLVGRDVPCFENGFYPPSYSGQGAGVTPDYPCRAVGWLKTVRHEEDVAGEQYPYWYYWLVTWEGNEVSGLCPETRAGVIPVKPAYSHLTEMPIIGGGCCHSICVSDFLSYGENPFSDDTCGPTPKAKTETWYHLLFCPDHSKELSSSETTAKTKNKLTAEENSKLGSITNSQATQTGLLSKILDAFENLKSLLLHKQATAPPVVPSDVPPPAPEPVPLSDDKVHLDQIPPSMSGAGSCPANQPFTVFGHHYSISNQPYCDFAIRVRSIVIASARVAAAWIILGAL